jgi:hypothetical protein
MENSTFRDHLDLEHRGFEVEAVAYGVQSEEVGKGFLYLFYILVSILKGNLELSHLSPPVVSVGEVNGGVEALAESF